MAAQFELRTSRNGKSYFNLLASNGEVILTSQMYSSRSGARKGMASVQANSGTSLIHRIFSIGRNRRMTERASAAEKHDYLRVPRHEARRHRTATVATGCRTNAQKIEQANGQLNHHRDEPKATGGAGAVQ